MEVLICYGLDFDIEKHLRSFSKNVNTVKFSIMNVWWVCKTNSDINCPQFKDRDGTRLLD